jgi:hypothetical protein
LTRELREETGIPKNLLHYPESGPFIAAAFNLRYGRDLNFYALMMTEMRSYEIGQFRTKKPAKDRWEVDRLEFLHRDLVTLPKIKSGELERRLPGRSRHLMGALYAWAVYADRTGEPQSSA